MSDEPLVVVDRLTRRYGDRVAVSDLSFDVRRGEMFGLIGPDGAGKTTTLRVILGLLAPTSGTVETCGLEPMRQSDALSRKIGYLSQRFSLYGDLTIDENIAFFAAVHGVPSWRPRRDELLELLRLAPFRERLADRLSGGMKQKLALACTLIHTPELLVLDEPTTGVDPVSRRDFWRILARLQREGLTLLLTTPYLDEAERCQRVALVDHGRLLNVSAPDVLRAEAKGVILEILAEPKRRAAEILSRRTGRGRRGGIRRAPARDARALGGRETPTPRRAVSPTTSRPTGSPCSRCGRSPPPSRTSSLQGSGRPRRRPATR